MKVIVGLGNPGRRYKWTRHNLGFLVVEKFAKKNKIVLKKEERLKAITGKGKFFEENIFLAMPQRWMNLSGISVRDILEYLKLDLENLLVVCDDINLPFGVLRIRAKGSSGGHKGLLSIIESIGTEEFSRLRIGILNYPTLPCGECKDTTRGSVWSSSGYLLSNFRKLEIKKLKGIIQRAVDACESWIEKGIDLTMSKYNTPHFRVGNVRYHTRKRVE